MGRKTRRKRSRRRRRKRGGACGCPLANTSTPLPSPPFEPPGGMYIPGATNGLDGGYYYGVNVDQSLPDPISSQPLMPGVKMTGGRRRRTRRKHRRRTKRRRKRRRRKTRRRRRRRRRRRKQRGGGWSRITPKEFLFNLVPKDVLDAGFQAGHKVGDLYRGYVGDRPKISPTATVQPIDQSMRTLSYKPIDSQAAYSNSINMVNTQNTPSAQAGYQ